MKPTRFDSLGDSGATLAESLVAFALIAGAAVAIYPLMFGISKAVRIGSVRRACETVVRGKLDEYRFGQSVNLATEATAAGMPQLARLSIPTLSDTSISGLNGGASNPTPTVSLLQTGGFVYSKFRYNRYFPASCRGLSFATILAPANPQLGMRECAGNTNAWDEAGAGLPCATGVDDRIRQELPGFKLYVKLELNTPWLLATPVDATKAQQFSNTCPNFGAGTAQAAYDFDGAGDAIKVTVTGVIDYASVGAIQDIGGLRDPNRLTCSVSAVIYPPAQPIRYYLTRTGRIYSAQGRGLNGSETGGWVFGNIYQQSGGGPMASGISSIAVHPRNLSIYVLKPGSLMRYSDCQGLPVNCNVNPASNTGLLNDASAPSAAAIEMPTLSSIRHIAIDFRAGEAYGMSANHSDVLRITYQPSSGGGGVGLPLGQCCAVGETPVLQYETVADGVFPKPMPTNALRWSGFFISPEGDQAYVTDAGSSGVMGASTFGASIYRALDFNLSTPVAVMPVDAVAFSK